MKKFTFLIGCLFASLGTLNAQDVKTATVNELLARLDAVENKLGAEPENLFTQEERLILRDHFNTDNSESSNTFRAASNVNAFQLKGGCENRGFGAFPLTVPYNMTFINFSTSKFYAGDQDDSGNLYGVKSDTFDENGYLVKINPVTGAETEIGRLNMPVPHVVTGLAWNEANQKWYVLSSNSDYNTLYTVDIATAQLTVVGDGQLASVLGIWLAIDNAGNAFTTDIGTHELFSINLSTGVATSVGFTGVQIRNAQDADFDPATGILYAAGHLGGGLTRMFSVDTATGKFTNTGTVNNGCANLGLVSMTGTNLGVSDSALKGFSFYPNPATDVINLKSVANIDAVTIYTAAGQQVINDRVNRKDSQINVSRLTKGVYMMKVEINGKSGTYKFIKK